MSKMFMDALDKHIEQVRKRAGTSDLQASEAQRDQMRTLLTLTADPALRRSLAGALKKLDDPPRESGASEILTRLTELRAFLADHGQYQKKRKPRRPKESAQNR